MLAFDFLQQASFVVTPGQSLPADVKTSMDSLPETASVTIASAHPTSDSSTEAKTATPLTTSEDHGAGNDQADSSELSVAAVAGIVIGSLSILVLAIGIFW